MLILSEERLCGFPAGMGSGGGPGNVCRAQGAQRQPRCHPPRGWVRDRLCTSASHQRRHSPRTSSNATPPTCAGKIRHARNVTSASAGACRRLVIAAPTAVNPAGPATTARRPTARPSGSACRRKPAPVYHRIAGPKAVAMDTTAGTAGSAGSASRRARSARQRQ